jgi:hypothetical protein
LPQLGPHPGDSLERRQIPRIQGEFEILGRYARKNLQGLLGAYALHLGEIQEKAPLRLGGKAEESHTLVPMLKPDEDFHLAAQGSEKRQTPGRHGNIPFHAPGRHIERVSRAAAEFSHDSIKHRGQYNSWGAYKASAKAP